MTTTPRTVPVADTNPGPGDQHDAKDAHALPSSTSSATRTPGRAPCRAAMPAQALRRAALTAALIVPSARSPPRVISSSVRYAVGTEVTWPNRSYWSPSMRKSLMT